MILLVLASSMSTVPLMVYSRLAASTAEAVVCRSDPSRPIFTNRSYAMDWFLVPWLRRTTLASLDSAQRGVL